METQHTPGPWEVMQVGDFVSVEAADPNTEHIIAICHKLEWLEVYSTPEAEANARLIAAAPGMLDTLQKCLDVFQSPDMPHSLRVGDGKQPTEDTILCLKMQIAETRPALS